MIEYSRRSINLGDWAAWGALWSCEFCGALVVEPDKELHNKYHESQARVADDASWGAMFSRPIG